MTTSSENMSFFVTPNSNGGEVIFVLVPQHVSSTRGDENLNLELEYSILQSTLRVMLYADEYEPHYIDGETYKIASKIADELLEKRIQTPKVFSHGGDAVSFVWERTHNSIYVTVGVGEISYFEMENSREATISNRLFLDESNDRLYDILGGERWNINQTQSVLQNSSPFALFSPFFTSEHSHSEISRSSSSLVSWSDPQTNLFTKDQSLAGANFQKYQTSTAMVAERPNVAISDATMKVSPWNRLSQSVTT